MHAMLRADPCTMTGHRTLRMIKRLERKTGKSHAPWTGCATSKNYPANLQYTLACTHTQIHTNIALSTKKIVKGWSSTNGA